MDPDLPHRPNRLTPAKLKAEESPATSESDLHSKELMAEQTSAALEADLPSDVKSEDFVSDETPASIEEDLTSDDEDDDDEEPWVPNYKLYYDPRVWKHSSEIPNEENIVEEKPNASSDYPQSKVRVSDYVAVDYEGLVSNEEDMRNFQLYIEDYNKSEGFDIEHFSNKIFGGLRILHLDEDDPCYLECLVSECKKSVEAALKYYNNKNLCHFELEKIVKCYFVSGNIFYATFDARDKYTGVTRTCQTQVGLSHTTGKKTIYRFRVKPESPPELAL